jgi:hypothetical protein
MIVSWKGLDGKVCDANGKTFELEFCTVARSQNGEIATTSGRSTCFSGSPRASDRETARDRRLTHRAVPVARRSPCEVTTYWPACPRRLTGWALRAGRNPGVDQRGELRLRSRR